MAHEFERNEAKSYKIGSTDDDMNNGKARRGCIVWCFRACSKLI